LLLVFATFSFTETEKKSNTDGDSAFTKVAEDYIKGYLVWHPQSGASLTLLYLSSEDLNSQRFYQGYFFEKDETKVQVTINSFGGTFSFLPYLSPFLWFKTKKNNSLKQMNDLFVTNLKN
jgi:hypothetical protein